MDTLKLALDWTPNINHLGFFVAREKGFYAAEGLRVEISDPAADNYAVTPAKKVELGQADLALCPLESVISYRTKAKPFPLVAMAALLGEDLSAIAVKSDSDIETPRDLDGKRYASYRARYEDEIVRQMIRNDGGSGEIEVAYPDKLGIWDTVLTGTSDATWVFLNWEGVAAEADGASLRYFKMRDYRVPYSYSPVLATSAQLMTQKEGAFRAFLAATRRGFLDHAENRQESLDILRAFLPEADRDFNLDRALDLSTRSFGNSSNWGRMDEANVSAFLRWLQDRGLENQKIPLANLMTNDLLPA